MGKAERNRQQSAREKIAAQQASARQADQRRKALAVAGSIVAVLAVVIVLVVVKSLGGDTANASGANTASSTVAGSVSHDIASVPATTLDQVAAGPAYPAKGSTYPHAIRTISPAGALLTGNGKPYVPAGYNGSYPFVDFGNRYVIDGASYDPALLANLTWRQIGTDLAKPSSTVGQAIDAAANHITAAICKITSNQPGDVCTSTGVTSASGSI